MSFLLGLGDTTGSSNQNHEHRYAIDPHGDGNTDIVNNHVHIIINGTVMPAGDDDHTHTSLNFPLENVPDRF